MSRIHGWRRSASRERLAMSVIARAPVGRHALPVGHHDLAHHRVGDEREQLVLRAHVVVERHRAGVELGGEAPHRHRLEALGVGDADRGRGDLVAGEARLAAAAARRGSTRRASRDVRPGDRACSTCFGGSWRATFVGLLVELAR